MTQLDVIRTDLPIYGMTLFQAMPDLIERIFSMSGGGGRIRMGLDQCPVILECGVNTDLSKMSK